MAEFSLLQHPGSQQSLNKALLGCLGTHSLCLVVHCLYQYSVETVLDEQLCSLLPSLGALGQTGWCVGSPLAISFAHEGSLCGPCPLQKAVSQTT